MGILPVQVKVSAIIVRISIITRILPVVVFHIMCVNTIVIQAELLILVTVIDDQCGLFFGFIIAGIAVLIGMAGHKDEMNRIFPFSIPIIHL